MYYEEKQIDGVWYYRTRPDGEWVRSAWQGNNV